MVLLKLLIYSILTFYQEAYNASLAMQAVSLSGLIAIPALVTALLIPLAFFVVENSGAYPFDRKLIFDNVIQFKTLVILLLIESILLCFADVFIFVKVAALLIDFTIVISTINIVTQAYKWICAFENNSAGAVMSFRQQLRIEYLNNITNADELYEIWIQIFNASPPLESTDKQDQNRRSNLAQFGTLPVNQVDFLSALLYALERIEQSGDSDPHAIKYSTLISLIIKNYQQLIFDNIGQYRAFVGYAATFAKNQATYNISNNLRELYISSEKHRLLKRILQSISEKPSVIFSHALFDELQEFTGNLADASELMMFQQVLLKDIFDIFDGSPSKISALWQHNEFLSDLSITEKDLEDEKSMKYKKGVVEAYNMYLSEVISEYLPSTSTEKVTNAGQASDAISSYLFGAVDLIFWFDLMTLILIQAVGRDREDYYRNKLIKWCELKGRRQFGRVFSRYAISLPYEPNLTEKERMARFIIAENEQKAKGQKLAISILTTLYPDFMQPGTISLVHNVADKLLEQYRSLSETNNDTNNVTELSQSIRHLQELVQELKNIENMNKVL